LCKIYEFTVNSENFFKKGLIFFHIRIRIGIAISTQQARVPKVMTKIISINTNGGIPT
jgi:hypothetical protein